MATSGSTNFSVNARTIVTRALNLVGMRVVDTADGYTAPSSIVSTGHLYAGVSTPSGSITTSQGTTFLQNAQKVWAQYGCDTETSTGTVLYPNRWFRALSLQVGLDTRIAIGRQLGDLRQEAEQAKMEAQAFTKVDNCLSELTMLTKAWQGYGIQTWGRETINFTTTASQASYTIGDISGVITTRPVRIVASYIRDAAGNDVTLTLLSKDEYWNLSDKDITGKPVHLWNELTEVASTVTLWPVPDLSTYIVYMDLYRQIEDFDAVTDDADFPQEWFEALAYNLAVRIARKHGRDIPPDVLMMAKETLEEARWSSMEGGSIELVPEYT